MTRITRRRVLAAGAGALGVGLIARRGGAAEFTYRCGNNVPATYPLNVRASEAAERIRQATGGRFDLQIFPNGQLGTDSDMLSQVRSGAIQFYTASGRWSRASSTPPPRPTAPTSPRSMPRSSRRSRRTA